MYTIHTITQKIFADDFIKICDSVSPKWTNQFVIEYVNLTDKWRREQEFNPDLHKMMDDFSWMEYEVFWYDDTGLKHHTDAKKKKNLWE